MDPEPAGAPDTTVQDSEDSEQRVVSVEAPGLVLVETPEPDLAEVGNFSFCCLPVGSFLIMVSLNQAYFN